MNRCCFIGRLGNDPETRVTTTEKSLTAFRVAIKGRSDNDTVWIRCVAFGKTSEYVSNYLQKGRLVGIEGRLSSRKYTDKEGNNREVVEIVADNVTSLERPREDAAAQVAADVPISDDYDPFA